MFRSDSMENTAPSIHTDRSSWAHLPTLSQLRKSVQQTPSPLMARNNNHQDKWQDSSALLFTPQRDATTMLISPPPEELLRNTARVCVYFKLNLIVCVLIFLRRVTITSRGLQVKLQLYSLIRSLNVNDPGSSSSLPHQHLLSTPPRL